MITTRWFDGKDDLTDAYAIRREVFIKEQNVQEREEMDGTDEDAVHLVVYDAGRAVATGRILRADGEYVLGRIAVLKEERGNGYGDLVMRMLIRKASEAGAVCQRIHAQIGARGFYEKLGFTAYGEEYMEAGIPHIDMVHFGDVGGCEERKC